MKRALAPLVFAIVASGSTARADNDDDFLPIGKYGQIGVGVITHLDQRSDLPHAFDLSLQIDPSWRLGDRVWAGGFLDLGVLDLGAALGPQLQLRVDRNLALQTRAWLGIASDGQRFAVAGLELGNAWLGAGVSARRDFEDGAVTATFDVDVSPVVLALPLVIGMLSTHGTE